VYAVTNHLHFDVPVAEMDAVLHEGVRVLSGLEGFVHAYVAAEDADRAVVIIIWASAEAAAAGAASFGPGFFAKHLAPRLESPQQRSAGDVLVFA
jgi:heme-degrading monooxygenase HmoA